MIHSDLDVIARKCGTDNNAIGTLPAFHNSYRVAYEKGLELLRHEPIVMLENRHLERSFPSLCGKSSCPTPSYLQSTRTQRAWCIRLLARRSLSVTRLISRFLQRSLKKSVGESFDCIIDAERASDETPSDQPSDVMATSQIRGLGTLSRICRPVITLTSAGL